MTVYPCSCGELYGSSESLETHIILCLLNRPDETHTGSERESNL